MNLKLSFTKLILPVISAGLLIFAVISALISQRSHPDTPPPVPPPSSPFEHTVAGAGMIEPSTEASGSSAIALGSQLAGVVSNIPVHIGMEVKAGDLLFELDSRQAEATLKVSQTALEAARQQLRRLELQPRPEEVPAMKAQLEAAIALLSQQEDQVKRDKLLGPNVVAEQDRFAHEQTYLQAKAQKAVAEANLALQKAGAWEPDKLIAAAVVDQARAQVTQAATNVELLRVRAPVDGTILQINIRSGEYIPAAPGAGLILMGNLKPFHVRVSIDEEDLPRLVLNAPARAKLRGDMKQQEIPLTFVRLEPFVVPKVSLTGANTERVDTRVAQVIYALDPKHPLVVAKKVLVGQIVDVFIDTQDRSQEAESPK